VRGLIRLRARTEPVENLSGHLKRRELTHVCFDAIGEAGAFAGDRLEYMQCRLHRATEGREQAELPI